jgi:hypothetical protein
MALPGSQATHPQRSLRPLCDHTGAGRHQAIRLRTQTGSTSDEILDPRIIQAVQNDRERLLTIGLGLDRHRRALGISKGIANPKCDFPYLH